MSAYCYTLTAFVLYINLLDVEIDVDKRMLNCVLKQKLAPIVKVPAEQFKVSYDFCLITFVLAIHIFLNLTLFSLSKFILAMNLNGLAPAIP